MPRNQYRRDKLFGVDIAPREQTGICTLLDGNLSLQPIPFDAGHFDSVSAFYFFKHVPRVLPTADGRATRFLSIEEMNEDWRVLRPGGLRYAVTPCYP